MQEFHRCCLLAVGAQPISLRQGLFCSHRRPSLHFWCFFELSLWDLLRQSPTPMRTIRSLWPDRKRFMPRPPHLLQHLASQIGLQLNGDISTPVLTHRSRFRLLLLSPLRVYFKGFASQPSSLASCSFIAAAPNFSQLSSSAARKRPRLLNSLSLSLLRNLSVSTASGSAPNFSS